MSGPSCLLWVQSLLGSGHLRRALAIAGALAADGFRVTLANGGPPSPWPTPGGVRLAQLPSVTSRDFATLLAADGTHAGPELWRARRERLLALVDEVRPDVLLTEMFPFGRRAFRDELLPLIARAREQRPRPLVLSSVRDVLVSKRDPGKQRWMLDVFREGYDAVLVHGDPALFPFGLSFPFAEELGPRAVLHTGFVLTGGLAPNHPAGGGDAPAVLVSAGGGAVGAGLLAAALDARPLTRRLADRPWLLVAGGNLPADRFAELAARALPPARLERHRADLASLIGRAEVSVSQAGYNTVAEGLAGGARMVLVPFAEGGEDEQTRRAVRLAGLGLAVHLPEAGLDARDLAAAVDRASAMARPDPSGLGLDGAARTATLIRELLPARRDA